MYENPIQIHFGNLILIVLPDNFGTPLQFNFQELMELEGTPIFYEIVDSKDQLTQHQENIISMLNQIPNGNIIPSDALTLENFLWVRSLFDSRGFILQIDGSPKTCLVPFADMLNHKANGQVSFRRFDEESQSFFAESLTNIEKGNQIFLSYGGFPGRDQVLFYGFLNSNFDVVPIQIEYPTEQYEEKMEILENLGLSLNHFLTSSRHFSFFISNN